MFALVLLQMATAHADPVLPVLLALGFLTLGAVVGGRLMTSLKQPAVLAELLVGVLAGNLGYGLGNQGLTVLREGDNPRKISDLALTTSATVGQAVSQVLPAAEAARPLRFTLGSGQSSFPHP